MYKYFTLYESHVKHVKYAPWKRVDIPYVENLDNRAKGTVIEDVFVVNFTNSHGNEGSVIGNIFRFWRVWFLFGKAFGYQGYPGGRNVVAILWRGKEFLHLRVPGPASEYLAIRIRHKEYEYDD